LRGQEFPSVCDVPPSSIATFTHVQQTDTLKRLLDHVWYGHG
jgi:hypothetical protein